MKRLTLMVILFLILAVPTSIVLAAPPLDTVVESSETINNDVVLFDDSLDVTEGATVNGNVTLFNGDARVAGTVNGDLVLFNGDLTAESTAVLNGECVLMNGTLTDNTESGLRCTTVDDLPGFIPALSNIPGIAEMVRTAPSDVRVDMPHRDNFFTNFAEAVMSGLLMAALAFAVASLLPDHLGRVQTTLRQKPFASGGVGVLTAVAVPSLIALLSIISAILLIICIGILGFGVIFVLALGLTAGLLFGWIALGSLVGQWLSGPLKLEGRRTAVVTAVGTLILTFVVNMLGAIPFVFGEGLITGVMLATGLGAVALTQFGMKSYPYGVESTINVYENEAKVTAVLDTLPTDDEPDLKK
ncbi:MAG: hypothetical protein H6662_12475 [Ardenticatenaceae bacterium]|nr:hypothetical protein [Anaerolineales bacterium]MCB8922392.1 hypothetical protein [Ardenticatenaceae bacterium]MCB8991324.1 hypothetical protein [Ardenticatenaceae bacterium]